MASIEPQPAPRALNERESFEELYNSHVRAISSFLFRRTGDHHMTEDLTAEVFVRAMRALPRFRARGVPLRHWLLRIADNLAINWATRRRGAGSAEIVDEPVARRAEPSDAAEQVREALRLLPKRFQTVLVLHYLEGLGIESLARVLRCRPGTVKSRLSRGRDALRAVLQGMGVEG